MRKTTAIRYDGWMKKIVLLVLIGLLGLGYGYLSAQTDTTKPAPIVDPVQQEQSNSQDRELKGDEKIVRYSDGGFAPREIDISVGTTVTFLNESGKSMWVGSDPHPVHTDYPEFDQLGSDDEYVYTFKEAGRYPYHNHLSPRDIGVIVVK